MSDPLCDCGDLATGEWYGVPACETCRDRWEAASGEVDGEAFRGGEAAAYAEEQEWDAMRVKR